MSSLMGGREPQAHDLEMGYVMDGHDDGPRGDGDREEGLGARLMPHTQGLRGCLSLSMLVLFLFSIYLPSMLPSSFHMLLMLIMLLACLRNCTVAFASNSSGYPGRRTALQPLRTINHSINPLYLRLGLLDRDFNSNDYEMLLALDQLQGVTTMPYAGATPGQINSLPSYTYSPQSENVGASDRENVAHESDGQKKSPQCAICLEHFENGEEVRILTCFHQFHASCVDQWLVSKAICPICKHTLF